MKRLAIILILGTVAAFVALAVIRGARADRCAESLVDAVVKRDRDAVAKMLHTPVLPDELFAAHQVELGFVRPISSEDTRVGLFVKKTATATRAEVVFLMLQSAKEDDESCKFVRDYETGAFVESEF